MNNLFLFYEHLLLLQKFNNLRVRLKHVHAAKVFNIGQETTIVIDGRIYGQVVFHANNVVLLTMPRRRMNQARTGIERYMLTQNDPRFTVIERMRQNLALKLPTLHNLYYLVILNLKLLHQAINKLFSHQIHMPRRNLNKGIVKVRMNGNGKVCRQCPRCCRPDDSRNGFAQELPILKTKLIYEIKPHIDGIALIVLILNLSHCKRCFARITPVNGFLLLINKPLFNELAKLPQCFSLIFKIHRQIRIFPIAKHT